MSLEKLPDVRAVNDAMLPSVSSQRRTGAVVG